jgi:catechol 2,3-dioxygenase-like lactoylglutathione lyase family enzyme
VTKDHEANRKFFEDILGMPLIATWCERAHVAEIGRELEYCHAFYGLADGGAIAFFQFADPQMHELFKAQHPKQARFGHIALKVDRMTFDDTERRLKAADLKYRVTDHGYCLSLYMMTPDELKLEFTLDPDNVGEIDAKRRSDAHSELKRWLAGDRRPNNSDHKSVFK